MFHLFLCRNGRIYVKTREKNVFVKPNEQCRACSNIVVARKRTFRGTRKERLTRSPIHSLTCPFVPLANWLTCQLVNSSTRQPVNLSTRLHINGCKLFGMEFNTMSALFVHQSPTLLQKIDSRGGWFRCKKGLAYKHNKMNFYLKTTLSAPDLGLFAAKC